MKNTKHLRRFAAAMTALTLVSGMNSGVTAFAEGNIPGNTLTGDPVVYDNGNGFDIVRIDFDGMCFPITEDMDIQSNPGAQFTVVDGGVVDVRGRLTLNGDCTSVIERGGQIIVSGELVINGDVTIGSGSKLVVSDGGRVTVNGSLGIKGKVELAGEMDISAGGSLTLSDGAEIAFGESYGCRLSIEGGGSFRAENDGELIDKEYGEPLYIPTGEQISMSPQGAVITAKCPVTLTTEMLLPGTVLNEGTYNLNGLPEGYTLTAAVDNAHTDRVTGGNSSFECSASDKLAVFSENGAVSISRLEINNSYSEGGSQPKYVPDPYTSITSAAGYDRLIVSHLLVDDEYRRIVIVLLPVSADERVFTVTAEGLSAEHRVCGLYGDTVDVRDICADYSFSSDSGRVSYFRDSAGKFHVDSMTLTSDVTLTPVRRKPVLFTGKMNNLSGHPVVIDHSDESLGGYLSKEYKAGTQNISLSNPYFTGYDYSTRIYVKQAGVRLSLGGMSGSFTEVLDEYSGIYYYYQNKAVSDDITISEAANDRNVIQNASVSLGGDIGINLYIKPSDKLGEGAYVIVTGANGRTERVALDNLQQNGTYKVTALVSSDKMGVKLKFELFGADGKRLPLYTTSGKPSAAFEYSVKDYIARVRSLDSTSDDLRALVDALENYGDWSCRYFGGEASPAEVTDITASDVEMFKAAVFDGLDVSDLRISLLLDSSTSLRVYYLGDASTVSVTSGSKKVRFRTGSKNGLKYVEIPGITATELSNNYTVSFGDKGSIRLSALTFANVVLNSSTSSDELRSTVKALVKYAQTAETYFIVPCSKKS